MSALEWHLARNLSRPETVFLNSYDDFSQKSQTYLHLRSVILLKLRTSTAQNMKFSVKNFFSKYEKTHRKLWICSHILKESSTENFIFSWQLEARKTYNKNEMFFSFELFLKHVWSASVWFIVQFITTCQKVQN